MSIEYFCIWRSCLFESVRSCSAIRERSLPLARSSASVISMPGFSPMLGSPS